ncbi:Phenazine biosynthesis-like protein [Streptomyces sp. BpilaLS-43]|nr:Phenazine biosynthesis-like protein [Streptomyces sp. BpilaLS-43]
MAGVGAGLPRPRPLPGRRGGGGPATGAAAAAFGAYARTLTVVPDDAVLTLHQGADMGRPGTLTVELRPGDPRIRVSGTGTRIG